MPKFRPLHAIATVLALMLFQASGAAAAQSAGDKIAGLEDIQKDVGNVPCSDDKRLAGVQSLFQAAGAAPADVKLEQLKGVENLVVVKQGESSEKIVIGAHYDKVRDGCGAVDNWTGIVAMSHVYKTLRDIPLKKTLVFVAFGKEEKGLVGSHAMANAIGDDQVAAYCAMVNIDSLGMGPPQVADNMSSGKLELLAAQSAEKLGSPFAHASIRGADADSSSFVAKKIPAVTIHGLNNNWPRILHTRRDQVRAVDPVSVYLGYRLALSMVLKIDASPCDAFR